MNQLRMAALFAALITLCACTDNTRARHFGGTMTVMLPPGQSLTFATWKEASLWYATQPRKAGVAPVETVLHENTYSGLMQGKVVFKEQ